MGRLSMLTVARKCSHVQSFETVNPFRSLGEDQDRQAGMREESADPRTGGDGLGDDGLGDDGLGDGMISLVEDSSCFEVSRQEEGIEESSSRFSGGEHCGSLDSQNPVSSSAVNPLFLFVTVTRLSH